MRLGTYHCPSYPRCTMRVRRGECNPWNRRGEEIERRGERERDRGIASRRLGGYGAIDIDGYGKWWCGVSIFLKAISPPSKQQFDNSDSPANNPPPHPPISPTKVWSTSLFITQARGKICTAVSKQRLLYRSWHCI